IIVVSTVVSLGNSIQTWDEFSPALYRLHIKMDAGSGSNTYKHVTEVSFGVRTLKTQGTRFEINDRPGFIRGTVNSSEFPITGYPSTDKKEWLRIFTVCKSYG